MLRNTGQQRGPVARSPPNGAVPCPNPGGPCFQLPTWKAAVMAQVHPQDNCGPVLTVLGMWGVNW